MPVRPSRQPYRKEAPTFFHLKGSWLAMAWVGVLGESNRNKAEFHVQQWRQHVRNEAMQSRPTQRGDVT